MSTKILFIIGPQRAGTTWLHELFDAQSSSVYINRVEKEDYWFLSERHDVAASRQRFLRRRTGRGPCRLVVDATPLYLGHPDAIRSILEHFPDAYFVYVFRDVADRERSYRAHQQLNHRASSIIGYPLSDELFARQADVDQAEEQLRSLVHQDRVLRLEFKDLAATGGARWVSQLSGFVGEEIEFVELGAVNAKRAHDDVRWQWFYFFVRVVQMTRIHIGIRLLKLRVRSLREGYKLERSDRAWIGSFEVADD